MRKTKIYFNAPEFIEAQTSNESYNNWLFWKADSHVKRDKKRNRVSFTRAEYRAHIHAAVVREGEYDIFTGEKLAWHLISTYRNENSRNGRTQYLRTLDLLPTVDHEHLPDGTYFN